MIIYVCLISFINVTINFIPTITVTITFIYRCNVDVIVTVIIIIAIIKRLNNSILVYNNNINDHEEISSGDRQIAKDPGRQTGTYRFW